MPAWPGSSDYFEAVQAPGAFFADPDLKAAEAVCGPMGMPVACAGNFADVYQMRSADGSKRWAVKCFTKPVARLRERYREISRHLERNAPRLMVDFMYLDQGIRIGGEYFPVLKMDWVEGLTLRNYVEENLRKPKQLQKLYEVWLNVEPLLRKAGMAHGDLQHGNVLLVPGKTKDTLSLRLVDYDGLWVPALKGQPATEVGHPAYQHPDRARRNLFAPEIDLFPHFVIAATLRCLSHPEGPGLWKAFDNGDNLLFRKADLEAPGASPLFKALWDSGDLELAQWAGAVAACLTAPLESTPRLEGRVSRTRIYELTNSERQVARDVLGKQVRETLGDEYLLRDEPILETDTTNEEDPDPEAERPRLPKRRRRKELTRAGPSPREGEIVLRIPQLTMLAFGFMGAFGLALILVVAVWIGRGRERVAVESNSTLPPPLVASNRTAPRPPSVPIDPPPSPGDAPPESVPMTPPSGTQGELEAARKDIDFTENLKQIGLALHNYHDMHRSFPIGGTFSEDGQGQQGWLTALLPYVEEQPLYEQIDQGQPWNAPQNQAAFRLPVRVYVNPAVPEQIDGQGYALTHYAGNSQVLKKNASLRLADMIDGTSNTVLAGDVAAGYQPWGSPENTRDLAAGFGKTPSQFGVHHGICHVLLADGAVRVISTEADLAMLKALATPAGGEPISGF